MERWYSFRALTLRRKDKKMLDLAVVFLFALHAFTRLSRVHGKETAATQARTQGRIYNFWTGVAVSQYFYQCHFILAKNSNNGLHLPSAWNGFLFLFVGNPTLPWIRRALEQNSTLFSSMSKRRSQVLHCQHLPILFYFPCAHPIYWICWLNWILKVPVLLSVKILIRIHVSYIRIYTYFN